MKTHSSCSTIPSSISSGGAIFEVERKCMLNSFWDSVRGSPAAVNKKLLCSFHFLDKFPDVLSQYIQIGKAKVRCPFANARHRLPRTGLVNLQGQCVLVLGLTVSAVKVKFNNYYS